MFSVVLLQFPILWKLFDPRSVPRNRHFAILILSNLQIVQWKHFSGSIIISPSTSGMNEVSRERSACLRTCLLGHSSRYYCMIHNVKWPENLVGASFCKVWNDVDRWAAAEGREYEADQSGHGQGRHTMGNGDGKLLTIIQIQIKMALIQSFCLSTCTCTPLNRGWLQWKQVKVQQG